MKIILRCIDINTLTNNIILPGGEKLKRSESRFFIFKKSIDFFTQQNTIPSVNQLRVLVYGITE